MKKIVIINVDDVCFKTIVKEGKKEEILISVDEFENLLKRVCKEENKVVYISRKNQDEVREKLRLNGYKESNIYIIHDDLRKDDFVYVLGMIKEYFKVRVDDIVYVGRNEKDLKESESFGIKKSLIV